VTGEYRITTNLPGLREIREEIYGKERPKDRDYEIREEITGLRAQLEEEREKGGISIEEQLAGYFVALKWREWEARRAKTRLNRVVEIYDAARAAGNYAMSDQIRAALDVGPGMDWLKEASRYRERLDVSSGGRSVNFVANVKARGGAE